MDDWMKLIVPMTFVVIWALGQIFNRETKTEPVRRPLGPRSGGPPPNPSPPQRTQAPPRWPSPGSPQPPRDEEIVILRPETSPPPRRPTPPTPPRRAARGRSTREAMPRPAEAERGRPVSN